MVAFFPLWDRVSLPWLSWNSLCRPSCPETHSIDQAGLKLTNLPASASQVLGLKVCVTTARLRLLFLSTTTSLRVAQSLSMWVWLKYGRATLGFKKLGIQKHSVEKKLSHQAEYVTPVLRDCDFVSYRGISAHCSLAGEMEEISSIAAFPQSLSYVVGNILLNSQHTVSTKRY